MNFETKAVRSGCKKTNLQEHSEAIFTTSSFVFASAEQARDSFADKTNNNIYSRFTNPTVDSFINKMAQLENTEDGVATASGMAAIFVTIMAKLKSGDHLVASNNMFGTTLVLINNFIKNYGITVSWVNLPNIDEWVSAVKPNTKMFLLETPSNPNGEVISIRKLAQITKKNNILLTIDNCLLTPFLQQPINLGADIIIHSATKYIDGQGRTLAGVVLGNKEVMADIKAFMRSAGAVISPFNAWICLKGLETLSIRMQKHCDNALLLAKYLRTLNVKVNYLGLKSHPHYHIAKSQQQGFGAILTFDVGSQQKAFKIINSTKIMSITANLGDTKTTITHCATTTHGRITQKQRDLAGISYGLIRISVGLEHIDDIINDLKI